LNFKTQKGLKNEPKTYFLILFLLFKQKHKTLKINTLKYLILIYHRILSYRFK